MKRFGIMLILAIICISMLLPVSAAAQETKGTQASTAYATSSETTISPRADVIVVKFRVYNGVLQCRRWNETWGYWVDPYWVVVV